MTAAIILLPVDSDGCTSDSASGSGIQRALAHEILPTVNAVFPAQGIVVPCMLPGFFYTPHTLGNTSQIVSGSKHPSAAHPGQAGEQSNMEEEAQASKRVQ
jgi:hypothetical protein